MWFNTRPKASTTTHFIHYHVHISIGTWWMLIALSTIESDPMIDEIRSYPNWIWKEHSSSFHTYEREKWNLDGLKNKFEHSAWCITSSASFYIKFTCYFSLAHPVHCSHAPRLRFSTYSLVDHSTTGWAIFETCTGWSVYLNDGKRMAAKWGKGERVEKPGSWQQPVPWWCSLLEILFVF